MKKQENKFTQIIMVEENEELKVAEEELKTATEELDEAVDELASVIAEEGE